VTGLKKLRAQFFGKNKSIRFINLLGKVPRIIRNSRDIPLKARVKILVIYNIEISIKIFRKKIEMFKAFRRQPKILHILKSKIIRQKGLSF